jgi:large subunit ribosomal protein L10Ae
LGQDDLVSAIKEILKFAKETKKRKFVETVELQVGLKNFDFAREKKFSGSVVLPYRTKTKMSFVIIGDQKHVDEATALQIPHIDSEGLQKFKKDKKKIKKWGMFLSVVFDV